MKRQRLGEQGWRKVLERFAASGQTVSVFCTREGVSPSNFYQWRARLNSTLREARPSGFVDLGLVAGACQEFCVYGIASH